MNDILTSTDYIAVIGTSGTAAASTLEGYATAAETCLLFINAWSGEGNDRTELSNTDQDNMILKVANNCNNTIVSDNTIVSVTTVGARLLDAWIEHPNVTAVVYSSLLGEQSSQAIINVLYGHVNPSGRLAHTIAKNENNYPVKVCLTAECAFTEVVYLDYRYFDKHKISPRFKFGFGLSYTSFEYAAIPSISYVNEAALGLTAPQAALAPGGQLDLWDTVMHLQLRIKNTGNVDGAEVAHLYVGFPDEAEQPPRQLRGFEKIFLRKGEYDTVSFNLRRRDLSYWDVYSQTWVIAKGRYTFWVGSSSRDLRSNTTYTIS
ncbi:hypothetical protein LT330_005779 [Penicillium expansum]|nr:hypothetical protein LT330_005779 [Penicillium expansum]